MPDYALHLPGDVQNPMAFLEAKRMNESLTSDHRKKLFEATNYARDKGVDVQYCILTNGDRWELIEPDNGVFRPIFSLQISKKSATECAQVFRKDFPKPPGFDAATPTISPIDPSLVPPSPKSVIDAILSDIPSTSIDLPKVLAYFVFCFTPSILIGWNTGLWVAVPRSIRAADDLTLFILYIFFVTLSLPIAVRVVHLLFQYPKSKKERDVWRLIPLFTPISGDRASTLYWVFVAIVCGVGGGAIPGFFLGKLLGEFQATQPLIVFTVIASLYVLLWLLPSLFKRVFRNKQKAL